MYKFLSLLLLALALPLTAQARDRLGPEDVDIRILDSRGRTFDQYPARRGTPGTQRTWLAAEPGAAYAIQVRNRTPHAIGLVIAVDGRNVISGARSDLRPEERMYIIGPGRQAVYRGWRTGRDQVNRFYFTDQGDSYAGAWGDYSAMGVIAVAAFQEDRRYRPRDDRKALPRAAPEAGSRRYGAEPGTGFGGEEWSPSRQVSFRPEARPFARHFIKYEWRDSLCRRGIIDCRRHDRPYDRDNRFWRDDRDFAPYPPGHRPR